MGASRNDGCHSTALCSGPVHRSRLITFTHRCGVSQPRTFILPAIQQVHARAVAYLVPRSHLGSLPLAQQSTSNVPDYQHCRPCAAASAALAVCTCGAGAGGCLSGQHLFLPAERVPCNWQHQGVTGKHWCELCDTADRRKDSACACGAASLAGTQRRHAPGRLQLLDMVSSCRRRAEAAGRGRKPVAANRRQRRARSRRQRNKMVQDRGRQRCVGPMTPMTGCRRPKPSLQVNFFLRVA